MHSSPLSSIASLSSASAESERILVLASSDGRVGDHVCRTLEREDFTCEIYTGIEDFYRALQNGAGCLVVDADAITERAVRLLAKAQSHRPTWSDLPILVLTDNPADVERLDRVHLFSPSTSTNITLLQRPVHATTLATVVQSALRARRRQYEVRDLLAYLEATNEELRTSEEAVRSVNEMLEARVKERTAQVRKLAFALTTAEQQERSRIASILHDHLQQVIYSARMWAETLRDAPDTAPKDSLDQIVDLLSTAIDTTRSLTVELSPPVLRRKGLREALDWLADHMKDKHDLEVKLDLAPDVEVKHDDLRMLLFESTRELLFNVVKHADVQTASLSARVDGDRCIIKVSDEGVGFDPDAVRRSSDTVGGFGLFSVRERLNLVGGALHVTSAPDEGTVMRIEAPVHAPETQDFSTT